MSPPPSLYLHSCQSNFFIVQASREGVCARARLGCVCVSAQPTVLGARGKFCVAGWVSLGGGGRGGHEDSGFLYKRFKDRIREIKTSPRPEKINNPAERWSFPRPSPHSPPPTLGECGLQSERECRRVRRAKSCCAQPSRAGSGPPGENLPTPLPL